MKNKKINIKAFKPGDYIVITVPEDYKGDISAPGFKEAGLKGGCIFYGEVNWEAWTDEQLARVGLQHIDPHGTRT